MSTPGIDLRDHLSAEDAFARGAALRERTPFVCRDRAAAGPRRPDVLDFLAATNADRLAHLVPLRMGRMAASPYAFFRGAAGLMAADLADAPVSGPLAQLCGDAHAANFGLYGTPRGEIIMDINDFDDTIAGPWEWDLERLAASLVLAGREGASSAADCFAAARDAATSYRTAVVRLAEQPFLASWNALPDESVIAHSRANALLDDFRRAAKKARRNTSARVARKWTEHLEDHETGIRQRRFVSDPPILTPVEDAVEAAVIDGLHAYADTLIGSRGNLLARFTVSDIAFRIVGTGSVGLRSYLALLHGNGEEVLVLQVKQAAPSALAPFVAAAAPRHEGERIVRGARLVQAESDMLLGWTTIRVDGGEHPFIVRQFRNLKGGIDPSELEPEDLDDYGRLAGSLLARAHARSADPRVLAGYLADADEFDDAVARFAVRYADRTEADHATLVAAVRAGRIAAEPDGD
ncbi:DUF2252 domain-containing protein [Nocardia sp. CDC159]|uniref:DUF2252 domain-containing protein n=1 Tax=Nocardia pulmonis TaxID=2951408 RepID=A0A9X2IX39_9NOCA|nr:MULTISPECIES: DUF2252 domain-containing protein [Nocardia]MCM6772511.1 DUF2252 domain-containing protein [Nocardia pulmonis]MCM6784831.1 DUF2252 domain-containing protein [Nocardia sp. CDC159]